MEETLILPNDVIGEIQTNGHKITNIGYKDKCGSTFE